MPQKLHGHNYQLSVDIAVENLDPKLGFAFDFNAAKPLIRSCLNELDERILIPTRSPFVKVIEAGGEIEIRFAQKRYAFPKEDTVLMPLVNVTSEELARFACERLSEDLANLPRWTALSVRVEETRGQSVTFKRNR